MISYFSLLKLPGVSRMLISQLLARFPSGMLPLALLLHIEREFDSYTMAGIVLAVTSIGQAIAGPYSSRLMGRFGMRPVLITTLAITVTAEILLSFTIFPFWIYVVFGAAAGLSTPPIQPAVRTIYPKIVTSKQLTPLFSLDASAQEMIWVVGPVAATFSATGISTTFAILLSAAIVAFGGLWFILSPELGKVKIPQNRHRMGKVLKKPAVFFTTIIGFLLVGGAASIEAGVVAVFGHDGPEAGIILSIFSIGSLAGGLLLGHRRIRRWSLTLRLFIIFFGIAFAMWQMSFLWLAIWLTIAGIGIAPALAILFTAVSVSVKFSETPEAYGWVGTGQLIGAALGSAAAGFMIDQVDAPGAFWVASILVLLGVITAWFTRFQLPDMDKDQLGPLPDTEPIQL